MITIAGGKFTKPRTHRREDREIDLAFRQVTRSAAHKKHTASEPGKSKRESDPIRRNRTIAAISMCVLGAVLLVGILVGVAVMLGSNTDNGLILNNVTAAGVNIGGMTPEQAAQALRRATDLTYTQEDMVIVLPDGELRLSASQTRARLDVDALVQAAYNYGRTGSDAENKQAYAQSLTGAHVIAVLPYLELDRDYIRQTLTTYFSKFENTYTDSSYTLEGDAPELNGEGFDADAPCQTLVLYTGTPGKGFGVQEAYDMVLDAYSLNRFRVEVTYHEDGTRPRELDLEAIWEDIHREPVDALMNMESFQVEPEIYGYTFDLEKAQAALSRAEYGEELRIPLKYITPDVLSKDLDEMLLRDVLGTYETGIPGDADRTTNLTLACKAIDGTVIDPGKTFSFNAVVGKLAAENGYKTAAPYTGAEPVLGGGVCQVASTLYSCALLGDLRIVQRQANPTAPDYIDGGLDAAAGRTGTDLQFMNNTSYPIRIEARVSGSKVVVTLLGTDEKDYFIRLDTSESDLRKFETEYRELEEGNPEGRQDGDVIREGIDGRKVTVYLCEYSKETGKQITRDVANTSSYAAQNRILVKLIPKPAETTEATEETQETETTEATDTTGATTESTGATDATVDDAVG